MNSDGTTAGMRAIMTAHRAWGLRFRPHLVAEPQPEPELEPEDHAKCIRLGVCFCLDKRPIPTKLEQLDALTARCLRVCNYEREAEARGDWWSAKLWAERYDELEEQIFDLELLIAGI